MANGTFIERIMETIDAIKKHHDKHGEDGVVEKYYDEHGTYTGIEKYLQQFEQKV